MSPGRNSTGEIAVLFDIRLIVSVVNILTGIGYVRLAVSGFGSLHVQHGVVFEVYGSPFIHLLPEQRCGINVAGYWQGLFLRGIPRRRQKAVRQYDASVVALRQFWRPRLPIGEVSLEFAIDCGYVLYSYLVHRLRHASQYYVLI